MTILNKSSSLYYIACIFLDSFFQNKLLHGRSLQYFLASTGKVHAIARKRAQGSKPKGRIILAISYSSREKRAEEVVFANNLFFFAIELLSELLCLIF